jgi:hypothetical protein
MTIETSGAGITVVTFGKNTISASPPHLRHEDQDGERVDEAHHHAARHEPHQFRHAERAEDHLEDAGEDDGGDQVAQAVFAVHGRDDEGDGTGGGGDHRPSAADDGDRDGHGEGGEQADRGVDPGDDREGDRLGDQREGDNQAGQDLGAPNLRIVQPVGLEAAQARGRSHSSRRQGDAYLSCSGTPHGQAGACGKDAQAPGRHPADGPQDGPEVER